MEFAEWIMKRRRRRRVINRSIPILDRRPRSIDQSIL
jgi:hypothetical protein